MKKVLKKKIYQYTAIFEPDLEAGGYTVTIPSLPGCISEGNTFEEALKNIKEAASLYLNTFEEALKNIKEAASLYLEVMRTKKEEILREEKGVIIAPVQVKV